MSFYDVTPHRPPLLSPEDAARLEAPFSWTQDPVVSNPFWTGGRMLCALIVGSWGTIALVLRFAL
jgi:hypothetical protein